MPRRIPFAAAFFAPTFFALTFLASTALGAPASPGAAESASLAESASERAQVVSGAEPVLDPILDMILQGGTTADQALHATDSDGDSLTLSMAFGPAYMTVTTTSFGPGFVFGNVHLAPALSDIGVTSGGILVSDGFLVAQRSFSIRVTGENVAPVLAQPQDMTARVGVTLDQELSATDSDGDPLLFSKASGPAYMTVETLDSGAGSALGRVRLTAAQGDTGSTTGTVSVSDGVLTDQKTFAITIQDNTAPVLNFISDMFVAAGGQQDQFISATDNDGDPLAFSKTFGPDFVTVTTQSMGSGYAYGNVRAAPGVTEVGTFSAGVIVSDGGLYSQQSFLIYVSGTGQPPVLSQPADMTVTEGGQAQQTVTATDADGDYITIYNESGPPYMAVSASSGYGFASATITLSPGQGDAGTAIGTIGVTDFTLSDTKSFTITVVSGNFPPQCPPGSFTSISTQFGFGLIKVQAADLNGDALPDLVAELPQESRVAVVLGNGNGTFGPATNLNAGISPVSGTIADFNADGIPDLATVSFDGNSMSVFLGTGGGAFGPRQSYPVGFYPRAVVSADVNRDGKLDLLVANQYGNSVSVLRGLGDGTFGAATTIPAGFSCFDLATPDLNADGAPDLVIANAENSSITVYLNNGTGTFVSRTDYHAGSFPLSIAVGDLNGDAKVDVVVANSNSNSLSVFLGNGNGSLGPRRDFGTASGPSHVVILEVNGDGYLDLAATNYNTSDVSIFLGDGTGAFGARQNVPTGPGPFGMATADFDDDLRTDIATANYNGGSVTILLNGCAPRPDHPPVVTAPMTATVAEGSVVTVNVTASDPDGPAIATLSASFASLPVGHNAQFTPNASNSQGVFTWTPAYQDARALPYPVTFTATNVLSTSATTNITVTDVNRAPVADAGGPYTAFAGSPLFLDGSASADPDGDGLTFHWVFGDGTTGTGATPSHTYAAIGLYGIALTVSDGVLSDLATTTANIVGVFQARAFTTSGNRSIRLGAGKPQWCSHIEPVGRSYSNLTVDPTSIVMKSPGTGSVEEIHAIADKLSVGDHDGNGVEEITACFRKEDLRLLFSDLRGTTSVAVTLEGRLYTGGVFRAQMNVGVIASGGPLAASVSPNPLNPEATLTFLTTKAGSARAQLFDLEGRLVRTLMENQSTAAGYHDVRIDGRDERGARLASGLYFYRVQTVDGEVVGKVSVLK